MKGLTKSLLSVAVMGSVVAASAQATFPLRVEIDVSAKTSRQNVGAGSGGDVKIENVQCRVKIRKVGGQPYEDSLTAELYVIGRQLHTGYYGIIDVMKEDFIFTKENTFEFTSKSYPLPQTKGNINTGATYETYLLVVVDKDGKIVDTRSGRVIKEQGVALIREMGPLTLFDRDGNAVGKVENPGEAARRAAPAVIAPTDR